MATATQTTRPASGAVSPYKQPTDLTGLQRLAGPIRDQVAAALPRFMAKNTDRMLRCLFTECNKTPKLLECSPVSLFGALIQVAQLGLELGGPAGQAYLVPFKGSAQLIIGYKGYVTLAHRSGMVRQITPRIVREGDTFQIEYGTDQRIVHVPTGTSGPAVGFYAVVKLSNGGTDFEYMTLAQALDHRKRFAMSKNGGPWVDHFEEMALKTCIRKLAKRLPLSVEWVQASALDELAERDEPQGLGRAVVLNGEVDDSEADEAGPVEDQDHPGRLFDAPVQDVGAIK
jgi:recombination protein RecT